MDGNVFGVNELNTNMAPPRKEDMRIQIRAMRHENKKMSYWKIGQEFGISPQPAHYYDTVTLQSDVDIKENKLDKTAIPK